MRTVMVIWSVLLVWPISLSAQHEADSAATAQEDTMGVAGHTRPKAAETLLLAGIAGMGTGAFGGGLIGTVIDNDSGLDNADGAIFGGLVGTTLLIPTAVHLANHSRGNLSRSVLMSTLLGGALLGVAVAAQSGEIVLAIPFVQLFTAMAVERDTSKPR
jgi:hypothetical protein